MRKTVINPKFSKKTVLTDSAWHYVELHLKNKKNIKAFNYWNQSRNFFLATESLDLTSKPLTSYYCFLNATKALLTFKKINFDNKHGVSGKRKKDTPINLINECVTIHPKGVLSGLSNYLKEPISGSEENDLKSILQKIKRAVIVLFLKEISYLSKIRYF